MGLSPAQTAIAVLRITFLPLLGPALLLSLRGAPRWWWLQAPAWVAPISWYVLMRDHSVRHTYFHVVLWYGPTIAPALLSIGRALNGRRRRTAAA